MGKPRKAFCVNSFYELEPGLMNTVDACKGVGWVITEEFENKASQVRFYR